MGKKEFNAKGRRHENDSVTPTISSEVQLLLARPPRAF
jgi:hypothetical protein